VDYREDHSRYVLDKPMPEVELPDGFPIQSLADEVDVRKSTNRTVQPRAPMRRQGGSMRRGHSHGAIPEEQPSALPDAAVAELPGLFVDTP